MANSSVRKKWRMGFIGLALLGLLGGGQQAPFSVSSTAQPQQLGWEWNRDGNLEGWKADFHLREVRVAGGSLNFATTGGDPQFLSSALSFNASSHRTLEVRMKVSAGAGQTDEAQLFWDNGANPGGYPFSEENSARFTLVADGAFHTYRVDLAAQATWKGRIRLLRFDPSAGRAGVQGALDYVRLTNDPLPALDAPPTASLISVSNAQDGRVTITGKAGSAPAASPLSVVNLNTGDTAATTTEGDGSFAVQMPGFDQSAYLINAGTTGFSYYEPINFDGSPATIVYGRMPAPAADSSVELVLSGSTHGTGHYAVKARLSKTRLSSREALTLSGALTITSPAIDAGFDSMKYQVRLEMYLVPLNDRRGNNVYTTTHTGFSSLLTPSGLALAGVVNNVWQGYTDVFPQRITRDGNTLTVPFQLSRDTSFVLPDGHYGVQLFALMGENASSLQVLRDTPLLSTPGGFAPFTYIPQWLPVVLKVGNPATPRLPWVLLWNTTSNGSRGVVAEEDKGRFALQNKIAFDADRFVLPMTDERSGEKVVYRLEPFLPTLMINDKGETTSPIIPLKLPSGSLHVAIEKPDGSVDDLGTAPFQQMRLGVPMPLGKRQTARFGETGIVSPLELTTLLPQFEYAFSQYGLHKITMVGTIQDVYGNTYEGGGSYQVWVAKPLNVIEMGVFPGTPFEVGDSYAPTVRVEPGVPADVEIAFKLYVNSNKDDVVRRTIAGKANGYGYFHPGAGAQPLQIPGPGEYVVDVTASYWAPDGTLWMGSRRGANVVETPNAQLIAHGRRGMDRVTLPNRPQWFFYKNLAPFFAQNGVASPRFTFPPPFHSGDVSWIATKMFDGISAGEIAPVVRFQDLKGNIAADMVNRFRGFQNEIDGDIAVLTNGGEGLLLTRPPITNAHPVPDAEDYRYWAYWYHVTDRPGVAVRALVNGDDMHGPRLYWTFDDPYHFQSGNGENGDLPNDVKLMFGGIVYRDLAKNINQYAIYGSMAVIIANDDPRGERTAPPFQGAAGGPDGGPLLILKGEEIDLFITPTGVRPGEVLEVGDTFSFSGQLWPLLPSDVHAVVTSPGGRQFAIDGQANKIGYFYDPASDFVVNEPGRWTVTVEVTHEGMTSAGPVQAPFPRGDVLGSDRGSYAFYVVPKEEALPTLEVNFAQPADSPLALTGNVPAALKDATAHYTATMPGAILQQGTLPVANAKFSYTYDPVALSRDFPNLDVRDQDNEGVNPVSVDTITLTFFIAGKDANGKDAYLIRRVLLEGERLIQDRAQALGFVGAVPGTATGPDSDGDGVSDDEDLCPTFSGRPETDGC